MENKELNFKKYQNMQLKVTKVEDRRFSNNHPAGYNVGHVEVGVIDLQNCNTYQCLFLITSLDRYWHTSQVLEIWEHSGYDLLKTLNSTYKVEPQFVSLPGVQEKHSVEFVGPK